MCIFSQKVRSVSTTRIFARLDGDRQVLVYAMNLELERELAMVLPLPVPPGSGENAVSFIDLSGYPDFFDDVARAFPPDSRSYGAELMLQGPSAKTLVVHDVGSFVASYVPTPADVDRLDARFRVPKHVFAAYPDWGFAVFQLRPGAQRRWFRRAADSTLAIHPMALSFPTRRPRALFYPTLHVHDGATVPATAHYDHVLTCQTADELLAKTLPWRASKGPLGNHVSASRAPGIIAPLDRAYISELDGDLPNRDHWFEPPRCAGVHVLSGRGERFAFDLGAHHAHGDDQPAWHANARERLDDLHAGMMAGLRELTAAKAEVWELVAYSDVVPERLALEGNQLFERGRLRARMPPGTPGPFEVELRVSTDRVEPQYVRFIFARVPAYDRIPEIEAELRRIIDRAVG